MSWIFGLGGKNPPPTLPGDTQNNNESNAKTDESVDGKFGSAALERAAKAARELEKSKFAAQALQLAKDQERTLQLEQETRIKQFELQLQESKNNHIRIEQEEKRQTMQQDMKIQKAKVEYQDQLQRKRYEDQLAQQTKVQEDNLRKQEESVAKQEQMRRSTVEYEQDLRAKNEMKILEAKLSGKAKIERENRDIRLEQIKEKAIEDRKTILESITTAGTILGSGFQSFISDTHKITRTVGVVTLLFGGLYTMKFGIGTTARIIESWILKPSLIRETSRLNAIDLFKHPIKTSRRFLLKSEDAMTGIVLKPDIEARLREIAIATRHTKNNKGFYRNLLMCGPPGTGKTMFAKSLAMHSGMDYAIMTGGDVAPMGKDGVTAIHKVFDWASTSRRGLLLFVDEADAFLRKRSQERISEDMRATLNAFLYRTGEQSKMFMLVLASNQPEQFDWAINDRIDVIVDFVLPTLPERERLVRHYFDKHVLQPSMDKSNRINVAGDLDYAKKCSEIAARCEGLSGREISKIGVAWQAAAYASQDGVITEEMIDEKVEDAIKAHKQKEIWRLHRVPGSVDATVEQYRSDKDASTQKPLTL